MSEIKMIDFTNKGKYLFGRLSYCDIEKEWDVKLSDGSDTITVSFKQKSIALALCELLKESE